MTALTDHQAKLFALELQRRHPVGDSARIGSALLDARVDLNPHQVDAALTSTTEVIGAELGETHLKTWMAPSLINLPRAERWAR